MMEKKFNLKIEKDVTYRMINYLVEKISLFKNVVLIRDVDIYRTVNAKSIIGVMSLGLKQGDELEVLIFDCNDLIYSEIKDIFDVLKAT